MDGKFLIPCNKSTQASFTLLLGTSELTETIMRFLLIIGCLLCTYSALSQRDVIISQDILWYEDGASADLPVGKLGFENALWEDEIPFMIWEKALNTPSMDVALNLENTDIEVISADLLTERQLQLLPGQLVLEPRIAKTRSKYFLQVRIVPIWRDAETNQIKRLRSFQGTANLTPGVLTAERTIEWSENSVLAEGTFYKIAIAEDGVYRIDRSFLQSMGVNVNNLNPQNINIYGNGGKLLPFDNSVDRPDDPRKNAIFISGEQDGSFDENDFILFYGQGADTWEYNEVTELFEHTKHFYSDSAYYFIRIDDTDPLRITSSTDPGTSNVSVTSFADRQFVEDELVNLAKSGREFFGARFVTSQPVTYGFTLPNLLPETANLSARVAVRSLNTQSSFDISAGGQTMTLVPNSTGDGATSNFANLADDQIEFAAPAGNSLPIQVQFDPNIPDAEGWLDYLAVNVRRELTMAGTQMHFRDPQTVGDFNVAGYTMSGAQSVFQVWDITDPVVPTLVTLTSQPGDAELTFNYPADELKEFVAFTNFNYPTPAAVGAVPNQNLHGLNDIDLVVLTNQRYRQVAEEYVSIHENDGLAIALVDIDEVYNEFSSGNRDVTAVKMLMKMLYDRAGGNEELQPKYLQIIGDGTYRNRVLEGNSSAIISFQSNNSISPTQSYISDDYFGFLEDQYGDGLGDKLSIGVGRIPCESVSEGLAYLNKVRVYISENTTDNGDAFCLGDGTLSPYGGWRNNITFVADDMDGNGPPVESNHMSNSEEHGDRVYDDYNDYDVFKIYMDAYQQISTPGGERYPEAEDAIRRRVANGSLIVNYIGHGGERGWAHERVLNTTTIQEWTNLNRLPLFVTATCELARFDDPEFKSAGELLVMNPQGGAIAMLTTTRIVFSGSNQQLNRAFFKVALEDADIEDLTLGFITMETKNDDGVNDSSNKRNFSLLGDVALKLAYPQQEVYTTEINGLEIDPLLPDTVRSLQEVTIRGFVGNKAGDKLTDFNGFVYPTVFDKRSEVTTLNNDGAFSAFEFEIWKNIIYKGKASVTNGDFEFSFIVPRDIAFDFGVGRISYYAVAGNIDAHGHSETFIIGGALDGAELNDVGPEVNLFLNDSTFVFGGITDENPILFATVEDENGVNTVGSGIGHDIKAILDENTSDPIILNDFYESDLDTYQSGSIRYQLSDLSEGTHTLSLKVWDVHNNSSEVFTEFVVANSGELALEHVLNYPNPFTTRTEFMFEHNQACDFLDVSIQVFTVGGKMVKSINRTVYSDGFRSEPIEWNGLDDYGDVIGRGVYVYRVKVRTPEGQSAEKFEKLVILR